MKDITNRLTRFSEISAPEVEINIFKKNKCILYTFSGSLNGYGYINSDKVIKIDTLNNIIYTKDEQFMNVLYEGQSVNKEVSPNEIHYNVLFILDCKIEAFLALINKTDF